MHSIMKATILSAVIASSNAFAPSSSFTPRTHSLTTTTTNNGSALHMNLFDRFSRVAKANLNNALKSLEDPEKILNQAVEDMQVSYLGVFDQYRYRIRVMIRFILWSSHGCIRLMRIFRETNVLKDSLTCLLPYFFPSI